MAIYRFRATIPESKLFFREYEINGDITLFALHNFLTSDLEFSPDQMFAFKGFNIGNKSQSTYGLVDYGSGKVDGISIEHLLEKGEEILLYIYDIKKAKFVQLAFKGEVEAAVRGNYPRTVGERGRLPSQFSSNEHIDELAMLNHGEEHPEEDSDETDDTFEGMEEADE